MNALRISVNMKLISNYERIKRDMASVILEILYLLNRQIK